jgi:hypothetical protein
MKTFVLALMLVAFALAAAPEAAASPPCEPENPCDPEPIFICHGTAPDMLKAPTAWAKWVAGCL